MSLLTQRQEAEQRALNADTVMKDVLLKLETDKRSLDKMSPEEKVKYDAAELQFESDEKLIGEIRKAEDREKRTALYEDKPIDKMGAPGTDLRNGRRAGQGISREERAAALANFHQRGYRNLEKSDKEMLFEGSNDERMAFRSFILQGEAGLSPEHRAILGASKERRDLQVDNLVGAGITVVPLQMSAQLIKEIDDQTFIRDLSTVIPLTSAESLGMMSLDADPEDPKWGGEIFIGDFDTQTAFGARELTPHPNAEGLKLSKKLIRMNPSIEAFVVTRLAYRFGQTAENTAFTGSGSAGQWMGLLTPSSQGIPTSQDVNTSGASGTIKPDDLFDLLYSLKQADQDRSTFILHRLRVRDLRKLKDNNGQYLIQPGINGGQFPTLLDRPFKMSERMPSATGVGNYQVLLGNFSEYVICEALGFEFQRLVERYADEYKVAILARQEADAMPVRASAFARLIGA